MLPKHTNKLWGKEDVDLLSSKVTFVKHTPGMILKKIVISDQNILHDSFFM